MMACLKLKNFLGNEFGMNKVTQSHQGEAKQQGDDGVHGAPTPISAPSDKATLECQIFCIGRLLKKTSYKKQRCRLALLKEFYSVFIK